MTKEQALEKKLEQVRWQFPNHVVFKHNNRVYHYDPNNVDEENIFSRTGLKVYKEKDGNAALYDPEYFVIDGYLKYKGAATEKIPQPINLKDCSNLFWQCKCETIDLSDWDFSEVISVCSMFTDIAAKTVIFGDVDFSKCENFGCWFYCCLWLQEMRLGNYRVLQDADVTYMFHCCGKLLRKYDKTSKELADIFKSGQWNSLQQVKKMEAFK